MDQIGNDTVYRLRKKDREMGVDISEVGVQIRKFAIFSIRTCYRSVFNHPFFVGMVLFLFFMHKSFPFLFSLFVSASPILVCTAVLLGTLLSFGQPNIPEIEKEATTNHEILSLKTGIQRDSVIFERDESFIVERHTKKRSDAVLEESIVEVSSIATEVETNDANLVLIEPPIEENSRKIQFEKSMAEREDRELHDSGFELKTETNEEKVNNAVFLENQYSRIEEMEDENAEVSLDKSPVESVDGSPISPWKLVEEEEEGVDDDEASDSGSDGAESSSPDASMADIIPILDELHPLLDEDTPHPAHMSHHVSDAESERSQKSSGGTNESMDDDSEHQEEEVGDGDDNDDVDDDDDDDEEEEETLCGKEDAIKSAIKWTEDDQKNLMDLGTSELERNQRLENLIARRRARRIMAEKNLMDFESSDLPFNIPPISTTCRNPFDLPYDSNDNSTGLPPIPGSAPSILLLRHNPFDIPYDSSEEKPDLKGDCFQQEFMPFVPKETFFSRHESFNLGPSFFGPSKPEKQDIKLSSCFLPERLNSEGTIYSSFHRQSGELSDSKASSVPETEYVCSAGDHNDKKLVEDDFSQDADLISDVGHPSVHVGHGSESSEDIESAEKRHIECDEIEIEMEDDEIHCEMVSSFSERRDLTIPEAHDMGEIHLNKRAEEVNYSSRSSSSSSSEVHERIFDEKEVSSSLHPTKEENVVDEPTLEESGIYNTMMLVVDSQHKEPVYDSSPPPVQNYLSSCSISSDSGVETSKNESAEELPLDNEAAFETKQDQVHSSGPDANFHVGIDEEVIEELLSPQSECASQEKPIYELEKQLEELVVPQIIKMESIAEVDAASKLDTSEFQLQNGVPTALADLDDSTLDGVEHPDHIQVQSFNFQMEATGSQVHDNSIVEEADEIKEIDEGLLMELDAVGDFSVEEFGSNVNKVENNRVSVEEMNSELHFTEARSLEHAGMSL